MEKKHIQKRSLRILFYSFTGIVVIIFGLLYFTPHLFLDLNEKTNPELAVAKVSEWQDDDAPTLVYAMPPKHWVGEKEFMTSMLLTAKKMGWNVLPDTEAKKLPKEKLKNAFGIFIVNSVYLYFTQFPDIPIFVINNFVPKNEALDPVAHLNKLSSNWYFKKIDKRIFGLGLTSFLPEINVQIHQDQIPKDPVTQEATHHIQFIMDWFLTPPLTYYTPDPKKLMYCGVNYPSNVRFQATKYTELWKKLDKQDYFVVYGPKNSWENFKSHAGYIPADGESYIKEIHKNGIYLIIHNEPHFKEGVPSGRIFEAAAAAAVIISDKHPFVEREFKDTVLYVDITREDLFEQIDAHMKWIQTHPEEAKTKARLAHAIFLQKFTEESQLARLYVNFQRYRDAMHK